MKDPQPLSDLFMAPSALLGSLSDHEFFHGLFMTSLHGPPIQTDPSTHLCRALVITMALSFFTTSGAELVALNNKNNNAYHLKKLHKISKHF